MNTEPSFYSFLRFNASRRGGGGGGTFGGCLSSVPNASQSTCTLPRPHFPTCGCLVEEVCVSLFGGGWGPKKKCLCGGGLVPQGQMLIHVFGRGRVTQEEAYVWWGPFRPHASQKEGRGGFWAGRHYTSQKTKHMAPNPIRPAPTTR